MKMFSAVLCRGFQQHPDAGVDIVGLLDRVSSDMFPSELPESIALCCFFLFDAGECGKTYEIAVRLHGPGITGSGKTQELHVPIIEQGQARVTHPHFVRMGGVPLPRPGDYDFEVVVDDESMGSVPLSVTRLGDHPGADLGVRPAEA